jgi:hypothetical protein
MRAIGGTESVVTFGWVVWGYAIVADTTPCEDLDQLRAKLKDAERDPYAPDKREQRRLWRERQRQLGR